MYKEQINRILKQHLCTPQPKSSIFLMVKSKGSNISQIQLYRILKKFEKKGILIVQFSRHLHPKKKPTKFYNYNRN